jgi:hypothetical protein
MFTPEPRPHRGWHPRSLSALAPTSAHAPGTQPPRPRPRLAGAPPACARPPRFPPTACEPPEQWPSSDLNLLLRAGGLWASLWPPLLHRQGWDPWLSELLTFCPPCPLALVAPSVHFFRWSEPWGSSSLLLICPLCTVCASSELWWHGREQWKIEQSWRLEPFSWLFADVRINGCYTTNSYIAYSFMLHMTKVFFFTAVSLSVAHVVLLCLVLERLS